YCDAPDCGEQWASIDEPERCRRCGSALFHQDPDVLDTWFSSGLWPFSTLGWPDDTSDLRTFYPTSVMETGHDILFFWVARMVMFGLEFTRQAPFHTIYLHGLIRAEGGVKMSKTKGNVQDPLELIEQYGTDALRLAVTIGNTPGTDFTLTPNILDARRDFVNKLWNIGRFVTASTTPRDRLRVLGPAVPSAHASLAERWIASRLSSVTSDVTRLLGEFNFGEAARVVHDFVWDELADWYLEAYKVLVRRDEADRALLAQVYEKVLRLLHPFAPFVSEELWQRITTGVSDRPIALMLAEWPQPSHARDTLAEAEWADLSAMARATRTLRAEYHIEPSKLVSASIAPSTPERAAFWQAQADLLGALPGTRLQSVEILDALDGAPSHLAARSIATVAGGAELLIPAEGSFDIRAELARTELEHAEAQQQVQRLSGLLASEFARRAPPENVARERESLEAQRARLQTLERRHATLSRLSGGQAGQPA
ncbi:MAG: class I tRNA ligase family protein, partial [Chloroflexota bacterium]|nr:class I tRNA ligase family protein [Chloroflexota bacterium]